jgi:two-component system, cell cycle sensor histidine kinase PleC
MAPAQVARASTNTDSIKGLAQSLAKPAYRRLLVAEPALRRAVPLLIITFLITMAVGTSVQVLDHRREATAGAVDEIELFADFLASRLDGEAAKPRNLRRGPQEVLAQAAGRRGGNRTILVADAGGIVVAAEPVRGAVGRRAGAGPTAHDVRRHRRCA